MTDDPARTRFFALTLLRLSGAAMAVIGLLLLAGKLSLITGGDAVIGAILLVVGAFDLLFLPAILARRWQSPDAP